jgi:L-threonylcarbamoyladenylate synthase
VGPLARTLMETFWPGPLTLVLPKRDSVPANVTAGLDTVAVRVPNHPIAISLIRESGLPIAAPSANRSGRPSATTWQAVAEDLDGRIAGIVCGEPTLMGLESTVVDTTSDPPRILRPGGVSLESLQQYSPNIVPYVGLNDTPSDSDRSLSSNSPGLRHKHYQPNAKVVVWNADSPLRNDEPVSQGQVATYIGLTVPPQPIRFAKASICESVQEYAANLYDFFRVSDSIHADVVCCQSVPAIGIGVALMDRLHRASHTN